MSLGEIRERIKAACAAAGRAPGDVVLTAVSKLQPPEKIRALLDAGHRVFGESRVLEAWEKWPPLRAAHEGIELRLIGHLQTNKVKEAVALFDAIETVDREKLAGALGAEMARQGRALPCCIQVNTGEEPQKGGCAPRDLERLYKFCVEEAGLDVRGLMCIPPADMLPDMHFALLRKLAAGLGLSTLSMGMSADFETAIRHGATHVRVGTALFGVREKEGASGISS